MPISLLSGIADKVDRRLLEVSTGTFRQRPSHQAFSQLLDPAATIERLPSLVHAAGSAAGPTAESLCTECDAMKRARRPEDLVSRGGRGGFISAASRNPRASWRLPDESLPCCPCSFFFAIGLAQLFSCLDQSGSLRPRHSVRLHLKIPAVRHGETDSRARLSVQGRAPFPAQPG